MEAQVESGSHESSSSFSPRRVTSTYASISSHLNVEEGSLAEDHPLYPVVDLDIIDLSVLNDSVFADYNIDLSQLCQMLLKYNRVPGRTKINLPWQVVSLMSKGGITLKDSSLVIDSNKIITDLLTITYVRLDESLKSDNFGQNPLHLISLAGNSIIFDDVCRTKCADKTAVNNNGCNVIGYAALSCEGKDRHMLSHLAKKDGHNFSREEFEDHQGNRLLHYLGRAGAIDVMIHFIRSDSDVFDVDAKNTEGFAPLHLLLLHGHVKAFEVAFDKFKTLAEYEKTSGAGMNFAHCAAVSGEKKGVEFVYEKFPDLKQSKDDNGATIGLHGVCSGSKEFIKFLGGEGYGLDAVDNRGYGAFEYAIAHDKTHLLATLQKKGIQNRLPPLQVAAENGQCVAFDKLLKMFKTLDVLLVDKDGRYPIQYAKDEKTRRHIGQLMVTKLLGEVNPFGSKHKLAEWDEINPSVSKTLEKYLSNLSTKAGSWIPKERVQEFLKKIQNIDFKSVDPALESGSKAVEKQSKKITQLSESQEDQDDDQSDEVVELSNEQKLLVAIREEMLEILVLRAKKSYDERAEDKGAFRKDFIGEYIRFLHACYQHINPKAEISDEDKRVRTKKEAITETAKEISDAIGDKATQLKDEFTAKNPNAAAKLGAFADKVVELKDRVVKAYRDSKNKTNGDGEVGAVDEEEAASPFNNHSE